MPKGVYPRGNKGSSTQSKSIETTVVNHTGSMPAIGRPSEGGFQTRFTNEDIRPEAANAQTVQTVPQIAGEEGMSTSERLFGDIISPEQAQALKSIPMAQNPMESELMEPDEPTQEEIAALEERRKEEAAKALAAEKLAKAKEGDQGIEDEIFNRKVKTKVDGVEKELTVKELKDSYQIGRHLAQAGEKLGEERRRLAEERKEIEQLRARVGQPGIPGNPQNGSISGDPRGTMQPNINLDPVMQRLNQIEARFAQAEQERNREKVVRELKDEGIEDPEQYFAKAQAVMASDLSLAPFYDTPKGFKTLVKSLAFEEAKTPFKAKETPVLVPSGTVAESSIQRPPITRIDSGSTRSSGVNDDSTARYKTNFQRAMKEGDSPEGRAAWNQVLFQKGILPDDI